VLLECGRPRTAFRLTRVVGPKRHEDVSHSENKNPSKHIVWPQRDLRFSGYVASPS